MVAFLAALPMIFAALKSAGDLFEVGKKVVEEVRGEPSQATNVDMLEQEVGELEVDQQTRFRDRMSSELDRYNATSQRLVQQGGRVDAETLSAIPLQERGRIARLRMTTRPWAVRWMVGAVVFPPLSLVAINLVVSLYNILLPLGWPEQQRLEPLEAGAVFNELYLTMVGWSAGVIMTYMGMREIGKAVGQRDEISLSDMTGSVRALVSQIKAVWR